jgi:uncharacterized protein YeaO (DUF488 family)
MLSPSPALLKQALAAVTEREFAAFAKRFRNEMSAPDPSRVLDLLAAMSQEANFSLGCYCENEARCHRAVLRVLLAERGAKMR